MKKISCLICCCLIGTMTLLHAQIYNDYLGAGHTEGISVSSSSSDYLSQQNNTMNGNGLKIDKYAAARFLGNASLGTDYEAIQKLANQGISDWLDEQFDLPPQVSFQQKTWQIWEHF
ncbi:MAG: hypothetical protein AAF599_20720, partial [Bacteroidota bacterium]